MESSNFFDNLELRKRSRQLLQDLKDEKERERTILSLIPIGISIATDPSCEEIIHNPASAEIFRVPGWHSLSLANPNRPHIDVYQNGKILSPEEMPLQRSTYRGETSDDVELVLHWPDGVTKHIQMSCRPMLDEDNQIIGALSTVKDITHIKKAKIELKTKNENLETVVRERTESLLYLQAQFSRLSRLDLLAELAGSIGHEIRNPMTTVRGYLQLLLSNQNTTDSNIIFELMIEELDRANSIITEFLSISKNKNIEFKECDLNQIISTLFPLMEARGLMTNVTITLELNEVPALKLDAQLINQLLLNLVHNGLEAMPKGGVLTIRTYTYKDEVIMSIQDEGPGIPPAYQSQILNPFFTTKENGTGLGLPVCDTIVRNHDAKIHFTSSKNGTTFFIIFPSLNAPAPKQSNDAGP